MRSRSRSRDRQRRRSRSSSIDRHRRPVVEAKGTGQFKYRNQDTRLKKQHSEEEPVLVEEKT